jgi:transcriptional regulator with XRE-family HTH domain
MEVFERINDFIKEKNLTKREFSKRLRDLEPVLNSTGETPSEKTIYKYLDGSIAIKIELIPYIAEVLQVTEQELFTSDKKTRKRFFQNIIKTANKEEIEILRNRFNLKVSETSIINEPKNHYKKELSPQEELISLLPYAPKPLLQNFITKLKELKEFNDTI